MRRFKIISLVCLVIFTAFNSYAQSLNYGDKSMTDIHSFYAILESFDKELRDLTAKPEKRDYESFSEYQKRISNPEGVYSNVSARV